MIRKILIPVQLFFGAIFLAGFIATFYTLDSIAEKSRALVSEKVIAKTSAKLDVAEELLNSNAAKNLIAEYQMAVIREEIQLFRSDPVTYVNAIAMDDEWVIIPPTLTSKNPLKNALYEKVFAWKKVLKDQISRSLMGLVRDIRIFLITNVIALLFAAVVTFKNINEKYRPLVLSGSISVSVALSSLFYLDQNWLFNVLLNSYAGFGYSVGIAALSAWLYLEYTERFKRGD